MAFTRVKEKITRKEGGKFFLLGKLLQGEDRGNTGPSSHGRRENMLFPSFLGEKEGGEGSTSS